MTLVVCDTSIHTMSYMDGAVCASPQLHVVSRRTPAHAPFIVSGDEHAIRARNLNESRAAVGSLELEDVTSDEDIADVGVGVPLMCARAADQQHA